jgi:hypothetical protein
MVIRVEADDADGAINAINDAGLDIEVWAEKSWGKKIEWKPGMAAIIEADSEAKVVLDDFGISYEVEEP